MIFNAMIEAMVFTKLMMGVVIDLGKIIFGGIQLIVETGLAIISSAKDK